MGGGAPPCLVGGGGVVVGGVVAGGVVAGGVVAGGVVAGGVVAGGVVAGGVVAGVVGVGDGCRVALGRAEVSGADVPVGEGGTMPPGTDVAGRDAGLAGGEVVPGCGVDPDAEAAGFGACVTPGVGVAPGVGVTPGACVAPGRAFAPGTGVALG
jgi:hypothetical protein